MLQATKPKDLEAWRECPDCGLFQTLPALPDGTKAICTRCGAILGRAVAHSLPLARASTVAAACLFLLALTLPLVRLEVLSRTSTSTLFSGPDRLAERGLVALGFVVLFTLVAMPAVKLVLQLTVFFGMQRRTAPRWLPWLFGWHDHLSPWAMVEVFLLGALVAYTRLRDLAHVDVGLAAVALGGVMLCMIATEATLDRDAIWKELDAKTPHLAQNRLSRERTPYAADARFLGCHACGRVSRAVAGERCPYCEHRLARRRGRPSGAWALVLGATLLYVPANVLPVMTVQRLGRGGPTTILHGVVELAQAHLWPLALLVLLASVVIPIFKLVSLATMLFMTGRKSRAMLTLRTRVFRLVKFVGRWSMIDIFMLTVLVGVVRFGSIALVLPGTGAVAFCAVVVLTMVATEWFDPRRMWDAGGHEDVWSPRTEVGRAQG